MTRDCKQEALFLLSNKKGVANLPATPFEKQHPKR
jgi:hypothetical protein